jgi:hypothetical protein
MRAAFLLVVAIATETVGAQGIFIRRDDGNIVRALFDEGGSMSADYVVSLSFAFGGMTKSKAEKSVGGNVNGDSSKSMGKAAKDSKLTKSNKVGSVTSVGKTGKMMASGESG